MVLLRGLGGVGVGSIIDRAISQILTRIYLTGTYGLVYLGRPVKDVDNYKDSKIDLE
jgi:hypothetical protein